MAVKYIPEGYHSVTPYLIVEDIPVLINFLKQTFDAKEKEAFENGEDKLTHAEVIIGESVIMMGLANENVPPNKSMLYIYTEDVDTAYKKALAAGGESIIEPTQQFYGDRSGGVIGPMGNSWWMATHTEDVSHEDMIKRNAERYSDD